MGNGLKAVLVALGLGLAVSPAMAETTKVAIGISGWTGFGPLTLAKAAGLFDKHGLDVTLSKIPQASRSLAMASGYDPVRRDHGRDLGGVERQRRASQADRAARQVFWRGRPRGARRHQDGG